MKTKLHTAVGTALVVAMVLGGLMAAPATAQSEGEQLFQQRCVACHTIGGGRLVGPDLAGVTERREEDWLISFIQSSQALIQSGDPIATRLSEVGAVLPQPVPA